MSRSSIIALVAGAVLGATVVFLFWALTRTACDGAPPPAAAPAAPRPAGEVHPTRPAGVAPSPAAGTVAADLSASCPTQLAAMTDRLAAAERKLEDRLNLDEKFERGGAGATDQEDALRAGLDKLFAEAPDGYSHQVECRGSVCKIEVVQPERGPEFEWNMRIQQELLHDVTEGYMMTSGTPSHDLVSKDALMSRLIYAEMNDADTVNGLDTLEAVLAALAASGAAASCAASDPTEGFLSLRLDLDPTDRVVTYAAGGTVASAAVGRCLLAALEDAIAATPVPPNARSAALYHTIETPPR